MDLSYTAEYNSNDDSDEDEYEASMNATKQPVSVNNVWISQIIIL